MANALQKSDLVAEGTAIALVVQQLDCVVLAPCCSLIKRLQCLWICTNPRQEGAGSPSDHLLSLIACTDVALHYPYHRSEDMGCPIFAWPSLGLSMALWAG